MKTCTKCKVEKSEENFSRATANKDGLNLWCRQCASDHYRVKYLEDPEKSKQRTTAWATANKDKRNAYARKYHKECPHRKGVYLKRFWPHLTGKQALAEYRRLEALQSGVCAICNKPETAVSSKSNKVMELSVDHDHKTGKVRGLLCSVHNRGLGYFLDSPEDLVAAAEYLKRN